MHVTKKGAHYHCRFRHNGTNHSISTHESDRRLATATARRLYHAILSGTLSASTAGPAPAPLSHAAIIAEYERYAAARALTRDLDPITAKANIAAYRRYLAITGTTETDPITTLTREHAAAYRDTQTRGLTPVERHRRAPTINGTLRHARSLYTRAALDYYTRAGHTLPNDTLTGWLMAPMLPSVTTPFRPPTSADIAALDIAATALWDSTSPHDHALATAYFLHRYFGLRNKEVLHARADWAETDPDGTPVLVLRSRADFSPKRHGESETRLRADPSIQPRLADILATARAVAPDAHLVYPGAVRTPNKSERTPHGLIYRRLSRFVRDHLHLRPGPGQKTTYQLRKLFGSETLTATGSIEAAAALRNTPAVARAHYATLLHPVHSLPMYPKPPATILISPPNAHP